MRSRDDFGYSLEWLDWNTSNSIKTSREIVNSLAKIDMEHAENGTFSGMFTNMPYPVAYAGPLLKAVDDYQEAYNEEHGLYSLNYRFLEVGCGAGTKAVMASMLFKYEAYGFDIRYEMMQRAQDTAAAFGGSRSQFFQSDAEDFKDYGSYDVIFLNRMFVGPGQQTELERYVRASMHPDSYLITVNCLTHDGTWDTVHDTDTAAVRRKPL